MDNAIERGRRLVTVKILANTRGYDCFTEASLRHMIYDAQDRYNAAGEIVRGNGLGVALIRVGRRVLVDLDEFDAWLERHRQGQTANANFGGASAGRGRR